MSNGSNENHMDRQFRRFDDSHIDLKFSDIRIKSVNVCAG